MLEEEACVETGDKLNLGHRFLNNRINNWKSLGK